MRSPSIIGALVVGFIAGASTVHADGQKHLAVLEFEVAPGMKIDRTYFSDLARTAAGKRAPQLFVMTRESTEALLQANGKTMADCTGECEVEVGRRLGADYIISGRLTQVGTRLALTLRLFATADGRLLDSEEARGKSLDELVDAADSVIALLITPLAKNAELRSTRPATTEAYIGGATQEVSLGGDDGVIVSFDSAPSGAVVTVDGALLCRATPCSKMVAKGFHEVSLQHDGYAAQNLRTEAKAGAKVQVGLVSLTALVSVETEPPGAVALIDGSLFCQATPCSKAVTKGPHELSLQRDGYEPQVTQLLARDGAKVQIAMARIAALVSVETKPPGLQMNIDGTPAGKSPLPARELAPGAHEIVVDDPCWLRDGERVVLKQGEVRTVRIAPKERQAGLKVSAEDEKGNALEAKVLVDGREVGTAPGAFKVSVCTRKIELRAGELGFSAETKLAEGEVQTMQAKLTYLGPVSGQVTVEAKSGLEFVYLPGGALVGGNFPGTQVAPFALGRTATTVAAYGKCVSAGACTEPRTQADACNWKKGRENHPINCVDWNQAIAFCGWVGGRLPKSEEREWAASGGEGREHPWGNQVPANQLCWDGEGSDLGKGNRHTTCPVGAYPAGRSKQGLLDLAGNVWEWLDTDYHGGKEVRGGSWDFVDPSIFRASIRYGDVPSSGISNDGFRCAHSSETESWAPTLPADGDLPFEPPRRAIPTLPLGNRTPPPRQDERFSVSWETVKDNLTSVVWQREAAPVNAEFRSDRKYNWADAGSYCKKLRLGDFGGWFSSWRLPTRDETRDVVQNAPSSVFPEPSGESRGGEVFQRQEFWTADAYWGVSFRDGVASSEAPQVALYVRCVH